MLLFTTSAKVLIQYYILPRLLQHHMAQWLLTKPPTHPKFCNRPLDSHPLWGPYHPALQNLHWLPIPQGIHLKFLQHTNKAHHNQAPSDLTDLLHPSTVCVLPSGTFSPFPRASRELRVRTSPLHCCPHILELTFSSCWLHWPPIIPVRTSRFFSAHIV